MRDLAGISLHQHGEHANRSSPVTASLFLGWDKVAIGQDYFCMEQDSYHLIENNLMQIEFNLSSWK